MYLINNGCSGSKLLEESETIQTKKTQNGLAANPWNKVCTVCLPTLYSFLLFFKSSYEYFIFRWINEVDIGN